MASVSFVELIVAMIILALGVLGLASTSENAQRAMTRGRVRLSAVERAAVTVDSLRGRACLIAGSASGSGGGQSWAVSARGAVRYIVDSVQVNGRRFTVEGVALCP
jgi:type II secretory pathway component PulJ